MELTADEKRMVNQRRAREVEAEAADKAAKLERIAKAQEDLAAKAKEAEAEATKASAMAVALLDEAPDLFKIVSSEVERAVIARWNDGTRIWTGTYTVWTYSVEFTHRNRQVTIAIQNHHVSTARSFKGHDRGLEYCLYKHDLSADNYGHYWCSKPKTLASKVREAIELVKLTRARADKEQLKFDDLMEQVKAIHPKATSVEYVEEQHRSPDYRPTYVSKHIVAHLGLGDVFYSYEHVEGDGLGRKIVPKISIVKPNGAGQRKLRAMVLNS